MPAVGGQKDCKKIIERVVIPPRERIMKNNLLWSTIASPGKNISWVVTLLLMSLFSASPLRGEVIIDSCLSREEALAGTTAPAEVLNELVLLDVQYLSFDGRLHQGQLVVHKDVEKDLREIFAFMLDIKFPVHKAVPIVKYNWSDEDSMADNNTSAFCYRFIAGTTRLSRHATGRAVDINPFQNPIVYGDGRILPAGAQYDPQKPGTFHRENPVVQEFIKRGWRWGGDFQSFKDYHHFEKR